VVGACHTSFIVCEIVEYEAVLVILKYDGLRILQPNEYLYKAYDNSGNYIDDEYYDENLEDE